MVIWKQIKGFEDYEISNTGLVRNSKKKLKKMYPCGYKSQYLDVHLWSNNERFHRRVHILVASHFLNPPTHPLAIEVNHKDGDKHNNNDWNLEWCTRIENERHKREVLYASNSPRN